MPASSLNLFSAVKLFFYMDCRVFTATNCIAEASFHITHALADPCHISIPVDEVLIYEAGVRKFLDTD